MIKFWAGATACLVGLCAGYGLASRNSSGTMSGINGPYTAGSVISSSVINARFSDIETELTASLERSGKGGMLAALRGTDGTVSAPAFSFTSETGSGLYRIGSSDLGWAISGTKKLELTSSLFTITPALTVTGAATLSSTLALNDVLTQTISGSASTTPYSALEASLSDGNSVFVAVGKAIGANTNGYLTYTKNATAANSTFCLGINGASAALCTDGNNKTYVGSTGTGIATINAGSCTLNGGTPATCTATVVSGAKCVASKVQTGGGTAQSVSVSSTTLTVTSAAAGDTAVANYFCWI